MRKVKLSKFRKSQLIVFIYRILLFIATSILFYLAIKENQFAVKQFEVLEGFNFFKQLSLFHILWILWVFDMCIQLFPLSERFRNFIKLSKGAQKLHKNHYTPTKKEVNQDVLKEQIKKANRKALLILFLWCGIAFLAATTVIILKLITEYDFYINALMLLLTLGAGICDTICTLFWCPFRFIQKNRCCLTCRIYNWDHMMMFTPVVTVPSFYTWSLLGLGIITMIVWEIKYKLHPERFFEYTNESLRCKNCTDKRCKQFGQIIIRNEKGEN